MALTQNQVAPDVIEKVISAVTSFAVYGFPESHAISFASIAYASAWLKVHRPAEFYVGLLNNQPMGFYSSATLVKDAHRHRVKVLPVSVQYSSWLCTVEADRIIRLGFCVLQGVNRNRIEHLIEQRKDNRFADLNDFRARTQFERDELRIIAKSGALNDLATHRRNALWSVEFPNYGRAVPIPIRPDFAVRCDGTERTSSSGFFDHALNYRPTSVSLFTVLFAV